MKRNVGTAAQAFVLAAGLIGISNEAQAGSCTVTGLANVEASSNGQCAIVLTNGPLTFTNVLDPAGHNHNVSIAGIRVISSDTQATFEIFGSNFNQFNGITSGFDFISDAVDSNTTGVDLSSLPFGTPDPFNFISFSVLPDPSFTPVPPTADLPLNWALKLDPNRTSFGTSTATDLGGGQFRIDAFFDIFLDLSLDANLASPHFTAQSGETPGIYTFATRVPEPMTISLFGAGALGMAAMRRRKAKA